MLGKGDRGRSLDDDGGGSPSHNPHLYIGIVQDGRIGEENLDPATFVLRGLRLLPDGHLGFCLGG